MLAGVAADGDVLAVVVFAKFPVGVVSRPRVDDKPAGIGGLCSLLDIEVATGDFYSSGEHRAGILPHPLDVCESCVTEYHVIALGGNVKGEHNVALNAFR